MKSYLQLILLILFFILSEAPGRTQHYIVKIAPFCSGNYNEFSPVFYKGGIVFCSNQGNNSLISYKDEQDRLFKIFYTARKESKGWKKPIIFSKEITSAFNDGPVTFNENENIIYYSRNNSIDGSIKNSSDTSNRLGIYSAELINGSWTNIKPFIYNNPDFSFCTPALTPNGDRLYFSSDMPGGIGGMDLYYCNRKDTGWEKPVNLGNVINTIKNESFPFADKFGKLFFASDGLKGYGGKDIFYTREINGNWMSPVHLDSAINSPEDDFGILLDSTNENGFFSTNRLKSDDIFSFSSAPPEFTACDTLKKNNYCFTFDDEQHQVIDTIPIIYQWEFGDGKITIGPEVKHCFPGPGEYTVKLSLINQKTGKIAARQVEYNVKLENIEQAYINSCDTGIREKAISFDALQTNLKNFIATDYL